MKIKKSLLKAITVAVVVSSVTVACTKEELTEPQDKKCEKTEKSEHNCPGCGMG